MMFGLRKHFLLDPSIIFLNHGSFGATPRPVFRVYQHWQREPESQPVKFLGRQFTTLMQSARQALSTYLGTNAENIVYTTNATESLNIVARSLDLGPGDEVLSTDNEYGVLDRTWRILSKEHGFKYLSQQIPVPLTSSQAFVDHL
jgi:isopenicillin-N epimerase